jgi:hypothetical protein
VEKDGVLGAGKSDSESGARLVCDVNEKVVEEGKMVGIALDDEVWYTRRCGK